MPTTSKLLRWLRFGCFVPFLMMTSVAFVSAGEVKLRTLVKGNTTFAVDWYHQLRSTDSNIFFSPYSVSSALVIAAEGARGETALEMGKALHFPDTALREENEVAPWETSGIQAGMASLNDHLTSGDQPSYKLSIANALWGEQSYSFRPAYIEALTDAYGEAGIYSADFKDSFLAERVRINQWVADHTEDRITDIVPMLSQKEARLIRLIITNAIYFKGDWSEPFDEGRTSRESFFLADGGTVSVPMMQPGRDETKYGWYAAFTGDGSLFDTPHLVQPFQTEGLYPDEEGFAILELPYEGDEVSMVLVAPNSPDGLTAIEDMLSSKRLAAWLKKLRKYPVQVFLPKFKLETAYAMKTTLERLGMERAFRDPTKPDGADFTGMTDSTDPRDWIYISDVLHKAFVEVNEEGTEAAAATSVSGITTSMSVPFTPTFKADRPFLFLIRSRTTGSILFMGRIVNPTK